jgi:hypothetical protein
MFSYQNVRVFINHHHIGFTAGTFHFIERPKFTGICLKLCLYISPCKALMAVGVLLKTGF